MYTFTELGIKMTVLDGWSVAANPSKHEYGNIYNWEVTKPGADGKIVVDSRGIAAGWGPDCTIDDGGIAQLSIDVKDVAPTKRASLMLLSRVETYTGITESGTYTVIASSYNKVYATSKQAGSPEIANSDLKSGTTYYRCTSGPNPGMFLGLSKEETKHSARNDTIRAVSVGSDVQLGYSKDLPTTASSYTDIKKMLTSIE
jgi:hypothetical protein